MIFYHINIVIFFVFYIYAKKVLTYKVLIYFFTFFRWMRDEQIVLKSQA